MTMLVSKSPTTGETLGQVQQTSVEDLPQIFERARQAQELWAAHTVRQRAKKLYDLRETMLNRLDEIVALISNENGKPHFEAMINDVLPSVELLTYFARKAPRLLKDKSIHLSNPILLHRKSYVTYVPLGTVAVISPWNFPLFLPLGEIAMALVAGNAVVFKPSEITLLVGEMIQKLCDESGFPADLLQTVYGDGALGAAMIKNRPDKIFFTGSVETGKKIMALASENLTPVNLELGGKDPMIVLADADLDYATSAALWGGFGNSGQVCASTERLLLHESIAEPFLKRLVEKTEALRQGPSTGPGTNDLGAVTYEKQKAIYEKQLGEARASGATVLTGGEFSSDHRYLRPTVIAGDAIEQTSIYKDETFGPVLAVTKFKSVAEAIKKANKSRYGLLASVITKNIRLGEEVARQIEAGSVLINEVAYTAAAPETPWGGMKDTGFGKKHSDLGLLEFVHTRHIHKPRANLFVFKSFWWFPYTAHQYETFRWFLALYRRSWFDKAKALPIFLSHIIKLIKTDKRI